MKVIVRRKLENIKKLLKELDFSGKFVTNQTAICILAFADQIAWGTAVWVGAEPNNLVLFQRRGRIDS